MLRLADFKDAQRRHWQDAELLFSNNRWANADHLYGFSAECGLKAVMQSLGMTVDGSGNPQERRYRKHANEVWSIFKAFASGRRGYWFLSKLPQGAPFYNWSVQDRYAHQQSIGMNEAESHRGAAMALVRMVKRAENEGRI